MITARTYVVVGAAMTEVQVHMLDEAQDKFFREQQARSAFAIDPAAARNSVLRVHFAKGAEYAFMASSKELMEFLALHYDGPHAEQLKGICACIAMGMPYSKHHEGPSSSPGGGEKVPSKPKPKGPPTGTMTTLDKLFEQHEAELKAAS